MRTGENQKPRIVGDKTQPPTPLLGRQVLSAIVYPPRFSKTDALGSTPGVPRARC